jgi:cell fate regulator YaaT (PSP1 superfamily)
MVLYKDEEDKIQSWEYLGYKAWRWKKATYVGPLSDKQKEQCKQHQIQADKYFKIFEENFGKAFPTSKTLCSRMHHNWRQIYFYFHAETRYNFSDFVKEFRSMLPLRFFLYQVGPRDRVRLHPNRHEWFDSSWLPLMYSIFKHPLANVESDAIMVQWLAWRDTESLKDRSGKFDHTLNFEKDWYIKESKKYPRRWQIIDRYWSTMKCMGCNILTQEIKLKGEGDEKKEWFDWERKVIHYDEYQDSINKKSV